MARVQSGKKHSQQPTLITRAVSYLVVNHNDLEVFIKAVYGHIFSFVEDQEACNDSEHTFSLDCDSCDSFIVSYELKRFIDGGGETHYLAREILNDLCRRGLIQSGEYLIHVSW